MGHAALHQKHTLLQFVLRGHPTASIWRAETWKIVSPHPRQHAETVCQTLAKLGIRMFEYISKHAARKYERRKEVEFNNTVCGRLFHLAM